MNDPSPQLIDTIARALYAADMYDDWWDEQPVQQDIYRALASAALAALPQPIAWMTAHLWPGDGEWTIRQPVHWTEEAARVNAGRLGTVVALVPVEDQ